MLAAFSTSAELLIATRALLGVAGATLAPSTLSLIGGRSTDPGAADVRRGRVGDQLLGRGRHRAAAGDLRAQAARPGRPRRTAGQLPGALGAALPGTARQAFTQGLMVTSAVSAVLTLGLAALAAVLLGRR